MLVNDLLWIWLGYISIRLTTTSAFKTTKNAGIWTTRIFGVGCFWFGLSGIIIDYGGVFDIEWNTAINLIMAFLVCGLIVALYFDLSVYQKSNNISISETEFKEDPLSLITWDMWLVTAIGLFFLIYYPLSI